MDKPQQSPAVVERRLVLEGDPEAQLQFAEEAARALVKRLKPLSIGGREYVRISGWQMVGRFFGATIGMEWSRPIERSAKVVGYEARAVVYRHGDIIATGEAQCTREERSWRSREEFALRAMAQTRAGSRAMRHAFGWVVELAGYSSTPAEEMDEETGEIVVGRVTTPEQYSQLREAEPLISVDEAIELRRILKEGDVDEKEFCQQAKIGKIEDLEQRRYEGAIGYYRKIKT